MGLGWIHMQGQSLTLAQYSQFLKYCLQSCQLVVDFGFSTVCPNNNHPMHEEITPSPPTLSRHSYQWNPDNYKNKIINPNCKARAHCTIIFFVVTAYALVWRSLSWCVAWFAGAALLQGGINDGIDCKSLLSICLQVMPWASFLGCWLS